MQASVSTLLHQQWTWGNCCQPCPEPQGHGHTAPVPLLRETHPFTSQRKLDKLGLAICIHLCLYYLTYKCTHCRIYIPLSRKEKTKKTTLTFFLFRETPPVYGRSEPRGWIQAAAASLHHRQTQQSRIWAASATYTAALGNARSLTHWARPGMEPTSSWTLCWVLSPWATTGTL